MITTATHDTKRSEDVRARLNVLSEMPHEWRESVFKWSRMNRRKKSQIDGQWIPDRNEEYLLYQTLLGVWPVCPMDERAHEAFLRRIKDYMLKAAREAKVNTSWISPNATYEEGLLKFIDALLSPSPENLFLRDFELFQEKTSYLGMFNSISQTLLKITCPGIPDFYQGTELWDFSLVDPDNRRPVDYARRRSLLDELKSWDSLAPEALVSQLHGMLEKMADGRIKLYVTRRALRLRRQYPELFLHGGYQPVLAEGEKAEYLCSYVRRRGRHAAWVLVPRFTALLFGNTRSFAADRNVWGNTCIAWPSGMGSVRNVFTGEVLSTESGGSLHPSAFFANFPFALLISRD
jgi:(1->4)-alpha-D-glucan 1-alpha-D-glucosylmutase